MWTGTDINTGVCLCGLVYVHVFSNFVCRETRSSDTPAAVNILSTRIWFFSNKSNQGSLEKGLIAGLRQGKYKRLEHLLSESKECWKKMGGTLKMQEPTQRSPQWPNPEHWATRWIMAVSIGLWPQHKRDPYKLYWYKQIIEEASRDKGQAVPRPLGNPSSASGVSKLVLQKAR